MKFIIVEHEISINALIQLAQELYGDMVKGVIDISKEIIIFGGEYHADGEAKLLELGSKQDDIWGFNLYPKSSNDRWIEYTSLINIRPRHGNHSYEITNEQIRLRISKILSQKIKRL
ncbi:MAG: DUF5674 family protein [Patescibacteria group bacterium]|nr:DUF5674 family protein [Patescibacteria group bacterium]